MTAEVMAALHDMAAVGAKRIGQGALWKHHVLVAGVSACMGRPVRAETVKPAREVFEWNRCVARPCAMRWPD